ncbi:hypothetical protein COV49_01435 [Candidatus Falkowbacteria bacterium CG11_big_fil_rev_8_21_14_0_20_39_10]|uniref:DNA polymerase III subunit delta n=1 Tax=Candidatus Falkowbacteria bacterium CG11_big_fil_rev_8_21_14_0_20_39_10 TaxID=1974570 RepID=A0A2M6K9H8_9BACT|nr:MAG: hypothetical protein COV49_01435 [Candidatus Falkowbacteria bacterium CG11_big_fil_rev_8_21_14_0_20_39_10]
MKEQKKSEKSNWPLVGNRHIIDFLSKSIANKKVSQAYIFLGPDNLGKTTVANYFAKTLLCHRVEAAIACGQCDSCRQFGQADREDEKNLSANKHRDFYLIKREPDKKNISIEQVREFIRGLSLSSFLNSYKIGVIKNAESLSQEAANALLKTLEEPKEKVVVILIAADLDAIPLTIASRSQILNFYPVKTDIIYDFLIDKHGSSRSEAKNLSRLALGRPALAVKFLKDKEFKKNYISRAQIFLDFFSQDINERLAKINEIMGAGKDGQESVRTALKAVECWRGLGRDLLLSYFGNDDLTQYEIFRQNFSLLKDKIQPARILKIIEILKEAQEQITANVNPKLALENVAVNV